MTQMTLLPELPEPLAMTGIVYLMTDGLLLKWGYVSQIKRLRQRKGELRAQIMGFISGTRADEAAYLERYRKWLVPGTEWFRLPDEWGDLYELQLAAAHFGGWQGIPATETLARVTAANLRQRRAA